MKKFNLSNKIGLCNCEYEDKTKTDAVLEVKDVKEFIKQLKGDFEECRDETDIWADEERWNKFEKMFKKRIKERAGKDLI